MAQRRPWRQRAARGAQPRREAARHLPRHRRRLQGRTSAAAVGQGDCSQKRMADNSKDNPDVWCLPLGNQQFNVHTFPRKVIQTPGVAAAALRNASRNPSGLHRRTGAAEGRSAAVVLRLLRRPLGRRHAGRGNDRLQGWWLARHQRQPADGAGAHRSNDSGDRTSERSRSSRRSTIPRPTRGRSPRA